jgi:streptogramin lyase
VAAVVVALGVPLALITRGGGDGGTAELAPGSVGVIDPKTNSLVDAIPVGFGSPLIAAGEGYVWVVDPNGSTLTKIDPNTRKTVWTRAIQSGATPTGLAVGKGSVWVGVNAGRTLSLLQFGTELGDLRDTVVVQRSRTPLSIGREAVLPAIGADAVFTLETARGEVSRIEGHEITKLTEGVDANAIAVGAGGVWLAGRTQVMKISPRTGSTLTTIPVDLLDSTTMSIQAAADGVWFTGSAQPRLFRALPSGTGVTTYSVGEQPSGIALGVGAVWVASGDSTVTRINPDESVETIPLAVAPAGIVAAYAAVWTSPSS